MDIHYSYSKVNILDLEEKPLHSMTFSNSEEVTDGELISKAMEIFGVDKSKEYKFVVERMEDVSYKVITWNWAKL